MQISISAPNMLAAIEAIDLVPSRAGITPSEFIQVEKKKDKLFFSLASEVYGKTRSASVTNSDGDWCFHVDRTALVPFISMAKTYISPPDFILELKVKKDSKTLLIRAGRRKVVFNAISFIQGYPTYAANNTVTVPLNKKQKELLQLAAKYAAPDPTLAQINCVYLQHKRAIYASNRITLVRCINKSLPLSLPLPLMLLSLLDNDKAKGLEVAKDAVKLVLDCGYICQSLNVVSKKEFPLEQIEKQFEEHKKYPIQFSIKASILVKAVLRLFACVSAVRDPEKAIHIHGNKNESKLIISCISPQGRFTESVNTIDPLKRDISLNWLFTFILPLELQAKALDRLDVRFLDKEKSPYYISSKAGIFLVFSRKV